jgi:hypothetical protein
MSKLVKAGRRLEVIVNYINQNHPKDAWILSTIEPLFIDGIQSYVSLREETLMVNKLNQLIDTYEFRFGGIFESLNEGLSPEVSNKAKSIFKAMINDRRDQLFKRYGAEAEKVAYGKAIAQAKRGLESPLEEINSDSYIQTRNQNPLIRDIANRIMERLKYSTK